jgi:hypothetical protein
MFIKEFGLQIFLKIFLLIGIANKEASSDLLVIFLLYFSGQYFIEFREMMLMYSHTYI